VIFDFDLIIFFKPILTYQIFDFTLMQCPNELLSTWSQAPVSAALEYPPVLHYERVSQRRRYMSPGAQDVDVSCPGTPDEVASTADSVAQTPK